MAQEALGDVEAALVSYGKALDADPSNEMCRVRRFQLNDKAEDWAACQVDIDATLAQHPDIPHLLLCHARLCVRNNRRDDALASYNRLIALEPQNAQAYQERSELQVGRGETLTGYADMARAFEISPDDPEIRSLPRAQPGPAGKDARGACRGVPAHRQLRRARRRQPRGLAPRCRLLSLRRGRQGGHPVHHARDSSSPPTTHTTFSSA